jgi:hypothetical protein
MKIHRWIQGESASDAYDDLTVPECLCAAEDAVFGSNAWNASSVAEDSRVICASIAVGAVLRKRRPHYRHSEWIARYAETASDMKGGA